MNPRDMDAILDAIAAYNWAIPEEESPDRTWDLQVNNFARTLGRWNIDPHDDARYADEHAWVNDIFKPETTCWTEERDRYPGFAPRRQRQSRNEELKVGDTTQLDNFLSGFVKQEV